MRFWPKKCLICGGRFFCPDWPKKSEQTKESERKDTELVAKIDALRGIINARRNLEND